MSLDFFKSALKFQKKYKNGKTINNYFQTNGVKINEEWAKFLKKHNFLVGLSIDGNEKHNSYRKTRSGKSTLSNVLKAVELFKKYQVEFNTLTVVNKHNCKEPLEVYHFLKSIGSQYIQFIPVVERIAEQETPDGLQLVNPDYTGKANVSEWSVEPKAYGLFLNTIFDEWVKNDFGKIFVMNFEEVLAGKSGMNSNCVFSENCGGNLALEANGDVYSCDHYVYQENLLGNINSTSLKVLVNLDKNINFAREKTLGLTDECKACEFKPICNGGCPKHRFSMSSNGIPNHNYLCSAYKEFFSHTQRAMDTILTKISSGTSLERIKREITLVHLPL